METEGTLSPHLVHHLLRTVKGGGSSIEIMLPPNTSICLQCNSSRNETSNTQHAQSQQKKLDKAAIGEPFHSLRREEQFYEANKIRHDFSRP